MTCECGITETAGAEFDVTRFREAFPEFRDVLAWPEAMILNGHTMALCYISPTGGKRLSGECRALAIDLMTAHLVFLDGQIMKGGATAMVSGASVDKVSVTLTPPPAKSQFSWWLSLTPRGQQLLALLKNKAAGGMYVGGLPAEREAFRKAGGVFVNGKGSS